MAEQNRYRIDYMYTFRDGWWGSNTVPGDTWQDAIHTWVSYHHRRSEDVEDKVVLETPSEDGRSGTMEIKQPGGPRRVIRGIRATIIEG